MASLADKAILSGADNRPPMLEKDMYDSWKSRMELYMLNRPHGRMIIGSVEQGPLIWPSVEVEGVTRLKIAYTRDVINKTREGMQTELTLHLLSITMHIWHLPQLFRLLMLKWINNHQNIHHLKLDSLYRFFRRGMIQLIPLIMMSFLTSVVASRYPATNNQLRTSSNPRQQATINNGRVTIQPIQGRQNFVSAGSSRPFTSGQGGAQGKQRVITCYNCKGKDHMSKQCTKPRRKRDAEWFKDKVLLVQAQANGQVLQEEELEFLADP
nr:hypothetical protein [Tanacetum cinerariifolium]